jgi:large subunit ribosomal protein L3
LGCIFQEEIHKAMKGIIGKKIGTTHIYEDDGNIVPVTIIQAGPCTVVQVKRMEKDGYEAIQLGFMEKEEKRTNRPLMGHFKRHGTPPFTILREFRVEDASCFNSGQVITVEQFRPGEKVDVTGRSKGRGFTGVMKRHGFSGAPGSHGTHEYFRHGGSIGSNTFPGRVFKGKRMAGHYGNQRVTIKGLSVVDIRPSHNLLLLKGAVPGPRESIVIIKGKGEYELSSQQSV